MPSRPLLWQPGINWSDWLVQRGLLLCEWGVVSHAARRCYGQYLSSWQLLSPGIQLALSLPCRHLFQCHGADELHGVLACFCWIFLNAHRCHFVQISCVFWGSRHDALLHSLQERPVRQHFGFLRCLLSWLRLHRRGCDAHPGECSQWRCVRCRDVLQEWIRQRSEVFEWVLQPQHWPGELLRVSCRLLLPSE